MHEAPLIETERLILRGFRRADLDALASILGDPEVVKHLTGTPMSREDSFRRIMMAVGQWPLLGFGYWAVELKPVGQLIGQVGFADFQRAMTPDISGEPEMGWIMDTSVHGQGFAREACEAALDWADANLSAPGYPAIISLENAPSIKLAERLGFERLPDGVYREEPIAVFRRPARLPAADSAASTAAS